jgi:diaminohydroxyphosphoribosylaminopyrimidine deaminase/5-amino-6-(5-phosphoribosylamino)uracil reductase
MAYTAADHQYMAQALRLAERGLYTTSPNPRVGCVIVNDGKVVGEGWHRRAGEAHAEVHALQQAGAKAKGATVYVTLEPCNHHGRTPPCADALIKAGVSRVVAAMQDPNPKVAGSGLASLQAHGIAAEAGLMQTQAHELNIGFISRMERNRPWVRSKIASSLDGKTALANGTSQWITSDAARLDVQHWRARSCAILTGVGTVLADDPQLNVRALDIGRQPLKIILDSRCRMSPTAKVLQGGALIVCATIDETNAAALRHAGAEVIALPDNNGRVDFAALMQELAKREINELHVEAGYKLSGSLLAANMIDELLLYIAPTLLGNAAMGMFDLPVFTQMDQRVQLSIQQLDFVGKDIRVRARVNSQLN